MPFFVTLYKWMVSASFFLGLTSHPKRSYLEKKGGFLMAYAGEKPGIGKYKCIQCGEIVELTSADEVLPACPQCEKTVDIRIC